MKTIEVEEAVARMFGIRQNLIVPNISWGLGLHECDLLVIRMSAYAVEVEIKVTRADLKKDAEKRHGHESDKIKEFYYAVPEKLYDACVQFTPITAGIIVVSDADASDPFFEPYWRKASIKRPATVRKDARRLTPAEVSQVARLGCMRIWSLKEKLIKTATNGKLVASAPI